MLTKKEYAEVYDRSLVVSVEETLREALALYTEETDNDGQIVIYTGLYRWADGTIHGEAEPEVGE